MMIRSISNTETAICEPRQCHSLSCDLCLDRDIVESIPLSKQRNVIKPIDKATRRLALIEKRRLAIIAAQELLALGI
jgi:hypothetical protein